MHGDDGRTYLDCGGFGVFLLGHCHPRVVSAVRTQLERHPLSTRLFLNAQLAEAAEALAHAAPEGLDKVFLTGSGAEATELGLKLARLAGRTRVVAMDGGFHGKTLGAVSVTGRAQYRDPFAPLLPDVSFVPFDDPAALAAALADGGAQTAVVLEPVQAEGGVRVPAPGYLREVRRQCTAAGALLVLDEIQTGLGRLGAMWGADLEGVRPDVLLTGKVLGGGVMPVGGVVATAEVFAPLDADPLLHSSTFAGSPLAAAAVTATLAVLREEGVVERVRELGPQRARAGPRRRRRRVPRPRPRGPRPGPARRDRLRHRRGRDRVHGRPARRRGRPVVLAQLLERPAAHAAGPARRRRPAVAGGGARRRRPPRRQDRPARPLAP